MIEWYFLTFIIMDTSSIEILNEWIWQAYELWKKHALDSLGYMDIIELIEKKNFTCEQLHTIYTTVEDMHGSDYESSEPDILWEDTSDAYREYLDGMGTNQ